MSSAESTQKHKSALKTQLDLSVWFICSRVEFNSRNQSMNHQTKYFRISMKLTLFLEQAFKIIWVKFVQFSLFSRFLISLGC